MEFSDDQYGTAPGAELVASGGYRKGAPGDLSLESLLRTSWEFVQGNVLETIGGMVLLFGITYGVQMVVTMGVYMGLLAGLVAFAGLADTIGEDIAGVLVIVAGGFGYMLMIAIIVIAQALAAAIYQMLWLKIIRGQTESINYLGALRAVIMPLVVSTLLVGAATLAGSLALFVGAFIVAFGLIFTSYLVVDHGLSGVQAVKESWALTKGYKVQIFIIALVLGGLNTVGMLACGVGMLVTAPLSVGVLAIFYNRIARAGNHYLKF